MDNLAKIKKRLHTIETLVQRFPNLKEGDGKEIVAQIEAARQLVHLLEEETK